MKTPLAKDIFDSTWNILERYCILLYRGTLRETVHRKNRKQIPLIRSGSILVDLDRLRLCTFSLPFTLDPKIVHSFPFRAPRYFPVSILFDILLQIERFLAPSLREKVLECIQNWISFEFYERSFSSMRVFVSFDSTAESSDPSLSDYSTCRFDGKKIFWRNRL